MDESKQKEPVYRRVKDICVDMYTQQEHNEKRVLNGKGLLNTEKGEFIFAQNAPRGARSVEVGRTAHSRFVRRPDGLYTVTFRVNTSEKNFGEILLAEVREVAKALKDDTLIENAKNKKK